MVSGFLPDVDDLGVGLGPLQDLWVAKVVVEDDVGDLDAMFGAQSDESEVSGAGAD